MNDEDIEAGQLRREVRGKYRDVALQPGCAFGSILGGLCPGKRTMFAQIHRALRPGGALQFADIANGNPVPAEALRDIDLRAA
jgi:hypothetical protein